MIALLALLFAPIFLSSQEYGCILNESFENGIPTDWSQDNLYGNIDWTVESGNLEMPSKAYDGFKRLAFRNNTRVTTKARTRLISPIIDIANLYQPILVLAHAQDQWTSDFDTLRILYRTSSESDWVQLKVFDKYISKWQMDTLPLMQATKSFQLAFEATDNLGRGVVIDKVEVRSSPNCFEPDVFVANISNDTVDVGWYGVWDAESFSLKVSTKLLSSQELADENYVADVVDVELQDVFSYTVRNLEVNTKYYYYIRSNCFEESSVWVVDSFTTVNFLQLPYSEKFNLPATTGYPSYLKSWYFGASDETIIPYINTGRSANLDKYSVDATYSLCFYGDYFLRDVALSFKPFIPAGSFSYAVLPPVKDEVNIRDLYISFWAIARDLVTADASANIIVGVMDEPTDYLTFTAVDTVVLTKVNQFEEIIVALEKYEGSGKYIALMSNFNHENVFDLDNVVVDYCPEVQKVNDFKIGLPTSNSIKLDFALDYETYEVVVSKNELPKEIISTTTDVIRKEIKNHEIITGLDNLEEYKIYARAKNATNVGEWSICRKVKMPGKIVELPHNIDLDFSSPASEGFLFYGNSAQLPKMTSVYQEIAPSKEVLFFEFGGDYARRAWAVFPELINRTDTRVGFYISSPDESSKGLAFVGLMSDASDISTFKAIDTLNLSGGNIDYVYYDLDECEGGNFFAIYVAMDGMLNNNKFYIDKVRLSPIPKCDDVSNIQVIHNVQDPTKVSLTWDDNGADAWRVRLSEVKYMTDDMYKAESDGYSYIYNDVVYDNVVEFSGLQVPKSKYYYTIQPICQDKEGDWSLVESFVTNCYEREEIPYTENFDSEEYFATTITSQVEGFAVPCMFTEQVVIPFGAKKSYYPYLTLGKGYSGKKSLVMLNDKRMDGKKLYVALPKVSMPIAELQLSFMMYNSDLKQSISVGVMTDPYDSTTIEVIEEVRPALQKEWLNYIVTFENYEGKGEHIVIKINDNCVLGSEFYIDDVVVEVLNPCVRPENVELKDVSHNTADIKWRETDLVDAWQVLVANKRLSANELASPIIGTKIVKIDTVSDNFHKIEGLESNTSYVVYVQSLCDNNAVSATSHPLFLHTSCVALTPQQMGIETFEGLGTGTRVFPYCYVVGNKTNNDLWEYVPHCHSSYHYSGDYSFAFSSSVTNPAVRNGAYAITSRLDIDDISDVVIKFWGTTGVANYMSDAYAHSIIVGVVSDPSNLATFEPIDTLIFASEWRPYEVYFDKYEGDYLGNRGKYVVFLSEFTKNNIVYIDDVEFRNTQNCYTTLKVDSTSCSTISVSFVGGKAPYQLKYSQILCADSLLDSLPTIDVATLNAVDIIGLDFNREYYLYARSSCEDGGWSEWSNVITAKTTCSDILTLPFAEDFEKNEAIGMAVNPSCWFTYYTSENRTYPYIGANAHSGARSVHMFRKNNTTESYLISKEIDVDNLSRCQVEFFAKGILGESSAVIGVVSDVDSIIATFEPVDTIVLSPIWRQYLVSLENYVGEGKHVAISITSENDLTSSEFLLDDVLIELTPSCLKPIAFSLLSRSDESLTLSFIHDGALEYEAKCLPIGSDPNSEFGITVKSKETEIQIGGLAAREGYDVYVRAICGTEDKSVWSYAGTYYTYENIVKEYPYECDFEDEDEADNWNCEHEEKSSKWHIGIDDNYFVSENRDANDKALYISSDGGHTAEYFCDGKQYNPNKLSPTSDSWACRTIYLKPGIYTISYTWSCPGYITNGEYPRDFAKVGLIPSRYSFETKYGYLLDSDGSTYYLNADPNTQQPKSKDWIELSEEVCEGQQCVEALYGETAWRTTSKKVLVTKDMSGIYSLVFYWTNVEHPQVDGLSVVIDDIVIEKQECTSIYDLDIDAFEGHSVVKIFWKSFDEKGTYNVRFTENGIIAPDLLTEDEVIDVFSVTDTVAEVTGLKPNTQYYAYVQTVCADGVVSEWSEPLILRTPCLPYAIDSIYTLDDNIVTITYNTANGNTNSYQVPECFVVANEKVDLENGGNKEYFPKLVKNGDPSKVNTLAVARSGDYALELTRNSSGNAGSYVVLPLIDGNFEELNLSFWMRCVAHHPQTGEFRPTKENAFGAQKYLENIKANKSRKITVGAMINPYDPETFVPIDIFEYPYKEGDIKADTKITDDLSGNEFWVKFSVPLKSAVGPFIAFKNEMYDDLCPMNKVYIDDIEVSASGCIIPCNIVCDSISSNSAKINIASNEAENYVVQLSLNKDFTDTLKIDTVPYFPIKIENLESNHTYFIRIKSKCSDVYESDWSMVYSFRTLNSVVYNEHFSELAICPSLWERSIYFDPEVMFEDTSFIAYQKYDDTMGWSSSEAMFETGRFSSQYMKGTLVGDNQFALFSPIIELTDVDKQYHLTFDLALTDYNNNEFISSLRDDLNNKFMVIISDDGGLTWKRENAFIWGKNRSDYDSYQDIPYLGQQYEIDLSNYAGKNIRVVFYAKAYRSSRVCLHLDNVHINSFENVNYEVDLCQYEDYNDNVFSVNSTDLELGANNFINVKLNNTEEGADTIYELTLNVKELSITNKEAQVCEGYHFSGYGFVDLTLPGFYKQKLPTANGCDSVVVLNLAMLPTIREVVYDTICQGTSLVWNSKEYTKTGVYSDTLSSVVTQCDSIVTLILRVNDVIRHDEYVNICYGETYDFAGDTISATGKYERLFTTASGCDSLVTLYATVLPNYSNIVINAAIAEGEVYNDNGFIGLTKAGTYTLKMKSVDDCDSIVTLNLVVGNVTDYLDVIICYGDSYQFGSKTIIESGKYIEKFAEDSVVLLTAIVLPDYRQTIDTMICKGESFQFGEEIVTESGVYKQELRSVDGCDSTITYNLLVLSGDTTYISETITTAELPYSYMDLYFDITTEPGEYKETIVVEAENCKDIIVYTLTIEMADAIDDVEKRDLLLVPNPVNANATLFVEAEFTIEERKDMIVEVFNTIGQRILVNVVSEYPIEIEGLTEEGLYIVRIIVGNGKIYQGKVIVK